jgi:thioredoxin-related protein
MYNTKNSQGNLMGKYLILCLSLLFISCEQETKIDQSISESENKFSIMHLSGINTIYTDYEKAFKVAKDENKVVFILFSTKFCRWCTKLRDTTLKDSEIVKRLNRDFIVLLLDKNYSKYPSKYTVKAVPAIYLSDKNEEIFTSIIGYHKNPNDYIKWFNYIKIELSN